MKTAEPSVNWDVSNLYNAMHPYIDSHNLGGIRSIRNIGVEIGHLDLVEWT